jgi:hypothetical protein
MRTPPFALSPASLTRGSISFAVDLLRMRMDCLVKPGRARMSAGRAQPLLALAFGPDHFDDLPPPDKIGQQPGLFVRQRSRLKVRRLGGAQPRRSYYSDTQ